METLLHFGLSNALMATVLALPAALVGRWCQRPALSHGLWLLVVLKLLTPPLLPVPVLWLSPPEPQATVPVPIAPGLDSKSEITDSVRTRPEFAEGLITQNPSMTALSTDASVSFPSPDPAGASPAGLPWTWMVGLLWGTGSLLWFATLCWRAHDFHCLLRGARRAPPDIQERARCLAQRLGVARCPGVWFVPGRVSPMLWALVGPPRLLLPCGLWSQLSGAQRDTLLAHELAHLRRRDHWVRWLELAAVGLYWWHPVAWWAERELQETGEQCCDAWVVAVLPTAADAYAEALLETVAYLSRARAALPVGASGAGRVHLLKRRLIMILNGTAPKALSPAGRWVVLALGAVLLPLWPTWAHSQGPRGNETSRPDGTVTTAGPGEDEGGDEQLDQARAQVKELTMELNRTRARVEAVAGRLREAQARLHRLQGTLPESTVVTPVPKVGQAIQAVPVHPPVTPPDLKDHATIRVAPGHPVVRPPDPKVNVSTQVAPALAPTSPRMTPPSDSPRGNRGADSASSATRSDRRGEGDYDQRLREVEAKLDRLLEEFRGLRERPLSRPTEPRSR